MLERPRQTIDYAGTKESKTTGPDSEHSTCVAGRSDNSNNSLQHKLSELIPNFGKIKLVPKKNSYNKIICKNIDDGSVLCKANRTDCAYYKSHPNMDRNGVGICYIKYKKRKREADLKNTQSISTRNGRRDSDG